MTIAAVNEPLDHPSYIVRQQMKIGPSTAGANTISNYTAVLHPIRIRGGCAAVLVAGTSAGNTAAVLCYGTCTTGYGTATGTALTTSTTTATLGTVTLTTNTAAPSQADGGPVFYTDMNAYINKGAFLAVKNGTDATGTYNVYLEFYHDPLNSQWTAGN